MQLYYQSNTPVGRVGMKFSDASEQMVCDAAAEILKRRTGKKTFEIELGNENSAD